MKFCVLVVLVVLSVIGTSSADRAATGKVIALFKQILPQYLDTIDDTQQQIFTLEQEGTKALVQFHADIGRGKETFVKSVTLQEDQLIGLLKAQDTSFADAQCMQFIAIAANQTVNLIGVAYTTCINEVDQALSNVTESYFRGVGELQQTSNNVRLLDVFRNDNVFYTPYNIMAKLQKKEVELRENKPTLTGVLATETQDFEMNLQELRNSYFMCMTNAELSFRAYIELARQQLRYICGGDVNIVVN